MSEDGPLLEGAPAPRRPIDAKPKLGGPEEFALVFASLPGQAVLEAIRQHCFIYSPTISRDGARRVDPDAMLMAEGARQTALWIEQQVALGRAGVAAPTHAVSSSVEPAYAKP
jgi:hypothetical protein